MNLKRLGLIGTQDLGQDCCCFKGPGMMHPGTEGTSQLVLFCQYKVAPEANETLGRLLKASVMEASRAVKLP